MQLSDGAGAAQLHLLHAAAVTSQCEDEVVLSAQLAALAANAAQVALKLGLQAADLLRCAAVIAMQVGCVCGIEVRDAAAYGWS